jgi:phosphoglucomutase
LFFFFFFFSIEIQVDGDPFTVEVVDSVADYVGYMKEIFEFSSIKSMLSGSEGRAPVPILLNAMNGGKTLVTRILSPQVFFFFQS